MSDAQKVERILAEERREAREKAQWFEAGTEKPLVLVNRYPGWLIESAGVFRSIEELEEHAREGARLDAEYRASVIGAFPCGPITWEWAPYRQEKSVDEEDGKVLPAHEGWAITYRRMHRLLP